MQQNCLISCELFITKEINVNNANANWCLTSAYLHRYAWKQHNSKNEQNAWTFTYFPIQKFEQILCC